MTLFVLDINLTIVLVLILPKKISIMVSSIYYKLLDLYVLVMGVMTLFKQFAIPIYPTFIL